MIDRPGTLGELRASGYQPRSVKQEMRANLIRRLRNGEPLFPGILGYEETVLPEIINGVLSLHDLLFLGLRGQGKTRMLRMLVQLLDEAIPVVAGSEIRDDPFQPLSRYARQQVASLGDACPIDWVGREDRYHEKLATPDVTIADLIGEIDLVKHAEGRHLSSEDVLHFGLIPRSHRGIFCMNELPDLSPRIQVGLFNVLEERDVQIRGFPVRLELDVCMVFSANPEDYTNRGRIVTPLKDRIGSVVRTHYPLTRELGIRITDENAWTSRDDSSPVVVPHLVKEVVEEVSRLARTSPHVNQASGVSVRMSIANFENVVSNAERRALMAGEAVPVARIADLVHLAPSSRGKLELSMAEDPGQEDELLKRIISEAIKTVFDAHFNPKQFRNVVEQFENNQRLEVADSMTADEIWTRVRALPALAKHTEEMAARLEPALLDSPARAGYLAGIAEFLLEALHSHNRLNRTAKAGKTAFGI